MSALPVDAHVHLHAPDRVASTLDAAARNFRAVGAPVRGCTGALLLAQAAGERIFEALCETPTVGEWSFARARSEPQTLIARRGELWLAVTCGRQVRATDGLEVLALGTLQQVADGLPFEGTVAAVCRAGGLPVLPWGFGKWWGRRGERVRAVLDAQGPGVLFIGDNGGRLALAGEPPSLEAARRRGFRVLPGSDPFPLAGDERRVGAFGFRADVLVTTEAPWSALQTWLVSRSGSPSAYGRACGPLRFAVNQAGIQLYRRLQRA